MINKFNKKKKIHHLIWRQKVTEVFLMIDFSPRLNKRILEVYSPTKNFKLNKQNIHQFITTLK